jgi:F-type H+-transporting ATPase subunit beta
VAEKFTGVEGRYVKIADTIKSFKGIINGDYDHIPEQAFFNCGGIEDVLANYEKIQAKEVKN